MKPLIRSSALMCTIAFATACATVGGGTGGTPTGGGAGAGEVNNPSIIWPIKTREHVDLWLHGFAMLQEDTTFVPFFRRGYGTDLTVLKNRANVVTQLDANRDRLRARLAATPRLINAQFVPLSFSSWSDLAAARYAAALQLKRPSLLPEALAAADRALRIDPKSAEAIRVKRSLTSSPVSSTSRRRGSSHHRASSELRAIRA